MARPREANRRTAVVSGGTFGPLAIDEIALRTWQRMFSSGKYRSSMQASQPSNWSATSTMILAGGFGRRRGAQALAKGRKGGEPDLGLLSLPHFHQEAVIEGAQVLGSFVDHLYPGQPRETLPAWPTAISGSARGPIAALRRCRRASSGSAGCRCGQPFGHLIPGVIRIGGADDDLEVGVGGPKPGNGFNAIPAWRHADIHKCQRIRPAIL